MTSVNSTIQLNSSKGDLYVVVSGCTTELVGDDIPAMAKEAREQGFPYR